MYKYEYRRDFLSCLFYSSAVANFSFSRTDIEKRREIKNYMKKITSKKETIVSSVFLCLLTISTIEEIIQQKKENMHKRAKKMTTGLDYASFLRFFSQI
jgi:hypothetical protein